MAFSYGKGLPRAVGEARVWSSAARKSRSDMIVEISVHYQAYFYHRRVKGIRIRLQSGQILTFGDCEGTKDIVIFQVTEVSWTLLSQRTDD